MTEQKTDSFSDGSDLESALDELVTGNVNEFGELEDDEDDTEHQQQDPPICQDDLINDNSVEHNNQSTTFAQPITARTKLTSQSKYSWLKNSYLAQNETEKEFELFTVFINCGGGRSISYISQITNLTSNAINKIAQRNNWQRRAADYDTHVLAQKLQEAKTARHERHLRQLEQYRQQQETLGHQMSLNAARISFLANKKLSSLLDSEQDLDIRDMPSLLNTAAKLAEVGKNLQSSALGVDQLLSAIEEAELD